MSRYKTAMEAEGKSWQLLAWTRWMWLGHYAALAAILGAVWSAILDAVGSERG
jgi:hypothetical protein